MTVVCQAVAVHGAYVHMLAIIREILLRMASWQNYYVFIEEH